MFPFLTPPLNYYKKKCISTNKKIKWGQFSGRNCFFLFVLLGDIIFKVLLILKEY